MGNMAEGKIVLYQTDNGKVSVHVHFEDETFWLTQKAMAELLGKTERHYQAIEAGCINVPATQLIFLAGYFQTSVDYLLGLSDQR